MFEWKRLYSGVLLKLFLASLLLSTHIYSDEAKLGPEALLDHSFDEYIEKALVRWGVHGLGLVVVYHGRPILVKGYGQRSAVSAEKVDIDTLFSMGSITKGMVTAALGLLADEGKLDWNAPVERYLPELSLNDGNVEERITVLDLLSHRSGLGDHDGDFLFLYQSQNQILQRLSSLEPKSQFRSQFAYQNCLYLLAGRLIEAVSGEPWHEFIRHRLLEPLGIERFSFSPKSLVVMDNVALGHGDLDGREYLISWDKQIDFGPAGALCASIGSMLPWMQFVMQEGHWQGRALLSRSSWDNVGAYYTPVPMSNWIGLLYPKAHFMGYGMGWFSFDWMGRKVLEHGGNVPGQSAKILLLPDEDIGILVVVNQHLSLLPHGIALYCLDLLLGSTPKDWSDLMHRLSKMVNRLERAMERQMTAERNLDADHSYDLAAYTGRFQHPLYGHLDVELESGRLKLRIGGMTALLEHWEEDTFRLNWRETVPCYYPGKIFIDFSSHIPGSVDQVDLMNLGLFTKILD